MHVRKELPFSVVESAWVDALNRYYSWRATGRDQKAKAKVVDGLHDAFRLRARWDEAHQISQLKIDPLFEKRLQRDGIDPQCLDVPPERPVRKPLI